jgi:lambda repressor-like predicted transcriptional regulator
MNEIVEIDNRDLVSKKLKEDERSLRWLSTKSGIRYSTLYSCIINKLFKLSDDNLAKVNKALNTNF